MEGSNSVIIISKNNHKEERMRKNQMVEWSNFLNICFDPKL